MSYGQGAGTEIYVVMNSQQDIVRKVAVTKEPDVGGYITIAVVTNATTDEFSYYLSVKAAFSNPEYVVTMPPDSGATGGGSFLNYTTETVFTRIYEQPWMNSELAKKVSISTFIWYAFTQKMPNNAIAVVVFLNGDVAKFQVINPKEKNGCCAYIAGTARDKNGNFINDRTMGGTGVSSGGHYVYPGPTGNIIIGSPTVSHSCVKVSNGSWYCEIVFQ